MGAQLIITGLLIYISRIFDVSIGTIRTIMTVQGKSRIAFFLGLFEITIWVLAAGTVITRLHDDPILLVFYALGYATGNVIGIHFERKLAFGSMVLRVITTKTDKTMAKRLREHGQAVTIFMGEGMTGPVQMLYIVCRRRDLKKLIPIVKEEDPDAFYITERTNDVNKMLRPFNTPSTGWRSIFKKK